VVTQAGAVCCYASVAILVRATVQLYSDPVTNRKLHDHLIAFLPPRLVMCTVLVLLLETLLQEHHNNAILIPQSSIINDYQCQSEQREVYIYGPP